MTEKLLLKKTIRDSGYKLEYVAKELGITRVALSKKLNGNTEFKGNEILKLSQLLNISRTEIFEIFFE